ncbi:MAG: organic hydroperoxide resistance protein [Phycisphaerales bacterium]|nr:organic hydroperoxide resistance protein [Phycisphaerales bacterium]
MPLPIEKVLYSTRTHTTGGREGGAARSDDGRLDVRISPPGSPGPGTNPEQLFAAGWSACFLSALRVAAGRRKLALPDATSVDATVDLGSNAEGYQLRARLSVTIPGVDRAAAEQLVNAAHQLCPYSKATRGNIEATVGVG